MQQSRWSRPEWWSVGLSLCAWMTMIVAARPFTITAAHHSASLFNEIAWWLLMVIAMMIPLSLDPIRATTNGSLWMRRNRAIAGFLMGYITPWVVFGTIAIAFQSIVFAHSYLVAASCFVLAAIWQRTSAYRRAVVACHRRLPLAPTGWQADRDCLRFGGMNGIACVRTCWPLMLACALAGHSIIAMACGLAVGALERWPFRPKRRAMLAVTLAVAGYCAVLNALC